MKLNIGNKTACDGIAKLPNDVINEVSFEAFGTLNGHRNSATLRITGKIARQRVQVDHRCEPGVRILVLFHPQDQVSLKLLVAVPPAAMGAAMLAPGGYPVCVGEGVVSSELWGQYFIHEGLFGLTFDDDMKPNQCDGLPPRTFFSQSSESV